MRLEIEAMKSMTPTEMDSNENELTMKKLKRVFEVSSVICSTASINMVIASLYGSLPDILGYKSHEMIFNFAFSLLVASILSFALAIATSRMQDMKMEINFPSLKISTFVSSHLKSLFCSKKSGVAHCEELCKTTNTQLSHAEGIGNLKDKTSNRKYSNAFENLLERKSEDAEYSKSAENCVSFPSSSDISSERRSNSLLQTCHKPNKLRHYSIKHSPSLTKSRKLTPLDLKRKVKKPQTLLDSFVTKGNFNEVNTRNKYYKRQQVGIVSPIKMNCSNDVKYCDVFKKISPSVEEGIQTHQKSSWLRFDSNSLLDQERFHQNIGRMSNECFEVDDNNLNEKNASIKSFQMFPGTQKEIFNNRHHATNLQYLHEVQNKFPKVRCDDRYDTEFLHTILETSEEFSNRISEVKKFNLHKIQKVDSGSHRYKLQQNVTENFKDFQDLLRDFDKAPPERVEGNQHHFGWNIKSKDWVEHFEEKPGVPMEICSTASSNDQVLEVSMKLKDLNFMF